MQELGHLRHVITIDDKIEVEPELGQFIDVTKSWAKETRDQEFTFSMFVQSASDRIDNGDWLSVRVNGRQYTPEALYGLLQRVFPTTKKESTYKRPEYTFEENNTYAVFDDQEQVLDATGEPYGQITRIDVGVVSVEEGIDAIRRLNFNDIAPLGEKSILYDIMVSRMLPENGGGIVVHTLWDENHDEIVLHPYLWGHDQEVHCQGRLGYCLYLDGDTDDVDSPYWDDLGGAKSVIDDARAYALAAVKEDKDVDIKIEVVVK